MASLAVPIVTTHYKDPPSLVGKDTFATWLASALKENRSKEPSAHLKGLSLDKEETRVLLFGQSQIHGATDLPAEVKAHITAVDCDKSDYCNALFPNRYRANLRFFYGGPEKLLENPKEFESLFFVRSSFNDQSVENLLSAIENSSNTNSQIVVEDLFSANPELTESLDLGFSNNSWQKALKNSSLECLSAEDNGPKFLEECQALNSRLKNTVLKNPGLVDHFNKLNLMISDLKNRNLVSHRMALQKTVKTSSLVWTDKPEEEQCILIMLSGGFGFHLHSLGLARQHRPQGRCPSC